MQTSFIPKKPIVAQAKSGGSSPINLFAFIGTTLFLVSLALAGGAYFYKGLVTKQLEADQATLERAKGAFDPTLIQQLVRLDTRIEASKDLLASHVAVTPLFDFLSTVTLRTVRFRDFDFSYLGSDKIMVSMNGQATSYAAVALQSDLFDEQRYLRDVIVSDVALDPTGNVSFNVSAVVDPALLSYSAAITPAVQPQVETEVQTETQPETQPETQTEVETTQTQ